MAQRNYTWIYILLGIGILVIFVLIVKMVAGPSSITTGNYTDPQTGSTNPQVTIVEYGDFQCPACAKMEPNLKQALQEFGDRVALVFNDFPLTALHPNGNAAAEAGQCAFAQEQFWPYHDILYGRQDEWSVLRDPAEQFTAYARELNLNVDQFQSCVSNHDGKASIAEDVAEANSQQISSTPTIFVGGERYVGTGGYDSLRRLILKHLPASTDTNSVNPIHELDSTNTVNNNAATNAANQ